MRAGSIKRAALPLGLALAILALALPLAADAVLRLDADGWWALLGVPPPSTPAALAGRAAALEALDARLGDPDARISAGTLHLRLATTSELDFDRDQLGRGAADLESGLARAPGDGFAWAALAQADIALGEMDRGRRAFRTSILFADFDPYLAYWRCMLGLELFSVLDEDDRRMWADQVSYAWDHRPLDILKLARRGSYLAPLRDALSHDPVRLAIFERELAKMP